MLHFHVVLHYFERDVVYVLYDAVLLYKPGSVADHISYNVPAIMLKSLKFPCQVDVLAFVIFSCGHNTCLNALKVENSP